MYGDTKHCSKRSDIIFNEGEACIYTVKENMYESETVRSE